MSLAVEVTPCGLRGKSPDSGNAESAGLIKLTSLVPCLDSSLG